MQNNYSLYCVHVFLSVAMLSQCCPALQSFSVAHCSLLTDQACFSLCKLSHLSQLDLFDCNQISNYGLAALAQIRTLQVLSLAHCDQLTDEGLVPLVQTLPLLRALDLTFCSLSTNLLLTVLALRCVTLEVVNVSNCSRFTDRGLEDFARIATRVRKLQQMIDTDIELELDLSRCAGLSQTAILRLATECRWLSLTVTDAS